MRDVPVLYLADRVYSFSWDVSLYERGALSSSCPDSNDNRSTISEVETLQLRVEAREHFDMMDKGGRIWEGDDEIDANLEIGHYVILCAPTSDSFKRPFWLGQVQPVFGRLLLMTNSSVYFSFGASYCFVYFFNNCTLHLAPVS